MTEMVDLIREMQRFAWPDYLVFVTMLILCILIGIYFGFAQKSSSETEYLMGGRNMMILPIALSLIARYWRFGEHRKVTNRVCCSFISGITLLGLPTEIYSFGIQYLYVIGGVITMGFVMAYVFLPVFHDLNITSTYEVGFVWVWDQISLLLFIWMWFLNKYSKIYLDLNCCNARSANQIVNRTNSIVVIQLDK